MSKRRTNDQSQPQTITPAFTAASAWRAKAEDEADVPTVPLTLPSGAVIKARRIPLEGWLATGKLPQVMVREFLDAHPDDDEGAATQRAQESLSRDPETTLETLQAMRRVVVWSVVWPRIVEGARGEGEIDPMDIPDRDFFFIFGWALNGAPDVPVRTKEGEVSVDALKTFRARRTSAAAGFAKQ